MSNEDLALLFWKKKANLILFINLLVHAAAVLMVLTEMSTPWE